MSRARVCLLLGVIVLILVGCKPTPTPAKAVTAASETRPPAPTKAETKSLPPTRPPASPTPAAAQRATAKAWYAIAEQRALQWQGDAMLTMVDGNNILADGSTGPADGKADLWTYTFASVQARKKLSVSVRGGKIHTENERELKHLGEPITDEALVLYQGLYPASDWQVDSDRALELAWPSYKERYTDPPTLVVYVLFNKKDIGLTDELTPNMSWHIGLDPGHDRLKVGVDIDARTGKVK